MGVSLEIFAGLIGWKLVGWKLGKMEDSSGSSHLEGKLLGADVYVYAMPIPVWILHKHLVM